MFEYLVIIAAVASLLAAFVYIRSMFVGGTKPNRVSWLMWAIAPLIATAAALSNGVGWAVLPVFMAGFSPFLIFTASFFAKKAYWQTLNFRLCLWCTLGICAYHVVVNQRPQRCHRFCNSKRCISINTNSYKGMDKPRNRICLAFHNWRIRSSFKFGSCNSMDFFGICLPYLSNNSKYHGSFSALQ